MRKIFRYVDGKAVECRPGDIPSRQDFDVENNGNLNQRVLKGYYEMEQQHGSRFPSNYKKSEIKRIHESRMAERG